MEQTSITLKGLWTPDWYATSFALLSYLKRGPVDKGANAQAAIYSLEDYSYASKMASHSSPGVGAIIKSNIDIASHSKLNA